jgi:hypothetical protein
MEKKSNAGDLGVVEVRCLPARVTILTKLFDLKIRPARQMTGIADNLRVPARERKGSPIMVESLRITQAERVFPRTVFFVTHGTVLLGPFVNDGSRSCGNVGMAFSAQIILAATGRRMTTDAFRFDVGVDGGELSRHEGCGPQECCRGEGKAEG